MKKVLITGISGFIGRAICHRLILKNFLVVGLSRNRPTLPIIIYSHIQLGESIADILLKEQVDAIIHCAHFAGLNEVAININGTKQWELEARQAGVPIQIFIGSVSAYQTSVTNYGEIKRVLEKWFLLNKHYVLNPGLVVGSDGLFGRIKSTVQNGKLIPLINKGRDQLFLTSLDSLLDTIESILHGKINPGIYFLHESKSYSLREVLVALAILYRKKPLYVSLPSLPIFICLKILETLRIPFPLRSSSIRGLKENSNFNKPTDLEKLGCNSKSLDRLLQEMK